MNGPPPPLSTPDAVATWVARMPARLRPWLRLVRADRPAGFWLLLWPCLWSTALALPANDPEFWRLCGLFLVGAILMRGAGCAWNDIIDRKLDAAVERTAARPIPAGEITVAGALVFAVLLSLGGLVILLQLGELAILLGIASLLPVALYPFAKRVTDWPQIVLGLTFNWGALMGWTAARGTLDAPALVLYAGCLFWTLGYDTIYAHQDRRDDAIVGIRSSARRLGTATRPALALFYGLFVLGLAAAGMLAGLAWPWLVGVALTAAHLARQILRLDTADPARCLALFRGNVTLGWLPFAGAVAAGLVA